MKQISWDNCGQCPFVQHFTGGKKLSCGHGDIVFRKPYADERRVEMFTIASFCPVPDIGAPVIKTGDAIIFLNDVTEGQTIFAQKDESGTVIKPKATDGRVMVQADGRGAIFYAVATDFTVVCGLKSMERAT